MNSDAWDDAAVWKAVILQMLSDLTSQSRKNSIDQQAAHRWFFNGSERRDFLTVCELAGYDPDYIRNIARMVMQRDVCSRAPMARNAMNTNRTRKK